jgi:BMFP domain-containing protein YqiC
MSTVTLTRFGRSIRRLRQLWAELGYAQRRMFEIRTGISLRTARESAGVRGKIEQLESALASPSAINH